MELQVFLEFMMNSLVIERVKGIEQEQSRTKEVVGVRDTHHIRSPWSLWHNKMRLTLVKPRINIDEFDA